MAAVGSGERCVERARPAALFRKSVFFQVKIIKPEILRGRDVALTNVQRANFLVVEPRLRLAPPHFFDR